MPARLLPVKFKWDGTNMVPLPRFKPLCDRQYVVDHEYSFVVEERRNKVTHDHYFASLANAWDNLPEEMGIWYDPDGQPHTRFPTPEHLRKWALVKCGYFHLKEIPCESRSQANAICAMVRDYDGYAVIVPSQNSVRVYTARSQSTHGAEAMDPAEFVESKWKVLNFLSDTIGTDISSNHRINDT